MEVENGIVHLWGAIATMGTNPVAFTLGSELSPSHNVFVPVTMFGRNTGRLDVSPNGNVQVAAPAGSRPDAQFITSLDGVTFEANTTVPLLNTFLLSPQNGWSGAPYATASPQAVDVGDTVQFEGAIATSGGNAVAFTLPPELRPQYTRYVMADMCNGTTGRLDIYPNGDVQVETEQGAWGDAQCFTSLDGASFIM